MSTSVRRKILDTVAELNELQHDEVGDPETLTRIAQYEMAYRMQTSVPELTDLSQANRRACSTCTAPTSRGPAATPTTA